MSGNKGIIECKKLIRQRFFQASNLEQERGGEGEEQKKIEKIYFNCVFVCVCMCV